MPWISEESPAFDAEQLRALMIRTTEEARRRICMEPRRVLLLPPDITRAHSGVGRLTEWLYHHFAEAADVHVIPTLGQHVPHTPAENARMFGTIPNERIHAHDWRNGCVRVGEVPASMVRELSQGAADWPLPVTLNRTLMEGAWDLIINVGHVVPHEVLGFANHNKNYFIGLAGKDLICAAHLMAAGCGIENNLGQLTTPLRACFDWAEERLLSHLPDLYVQVVLARDAHGGLATTGVHVGPDRETYLCAARQSRRQNVTTFEQPVQKMVCVMQADEFRSTWVANKAIYRTRMALGDGAELLIIAPGLERFGEQPEVDALIRKYGYCGTERVRDYSRANADLQDLAHGAAHLMHGSTEGRFTVRYAPGHLSRADIEGVHYAYEDLGEALRRYPVGQLREGWNTTADGQSYFFIPTPSAGLWTTAARLAAR